MYTPKVAYGDVDEPEMATVEILGTYETRDEACEEARSKFDAIKERLGNDLEVRFGEIEACRDNYYITYGYLNPVDRVYAGYDRYYMVSVIES